ncbi:hypothetical protein NHQ30_009257 [Ciborinia camelliae]|nr:hypothetical protein NHQ30_009257 [Ciborinia camelliae]
MSSRGILKSIFGPRVSTSSFGPKIGHPKCGYCTKNASIPCTTCNSTWYCRQKCRELDRPVHDMICQTYTDFIAANPCPKDTLDNKYRLGLLLPVDSEQFQLAWIANEARGKSVTMFTKSHDQDRINTRETLVDYNMTSKKFDHTLFLVVRGDFLTGDCLPNACINHLMGGNLKHSLRGPVAVVSERGHGLSRSPEHFQPCDLRILIDFLFHYEGKPKVEIGHACGNDSKNVLVTSVNRFLKFLKGKAGNGGRKSTNTLFDGEDNRVYRHREGTFTKTDWVMDSESFLPRPMVQHSKSSNNFGSFKEDGSTVQGASSPPWYIVYRPKSSINFGSFKDDESTVQDASFPPINRPQRSKSSIDFGTFKDDGSGFHRPELSVLPDFLPDCITEPRTILAHSPRRRNSDQGLSTNKMTIKKSASIDSMAITPIAKESNQVNRNENIIPSLSNKKNMPIKKSASIDSIASTPISKKSNQVYENDNIFIKTSVEIFNFYKSSKSKNNRHDPESIIPATPKPSVTTNTSFFKPRLFFKARLARKGKRI